MRKVWILFCNFTTIMQSYKSADILSVINVVLLFAQLLKYQFNAISIV